MNKLYNNMDLDELMNNLEQNEPHHNNNNKRVKNVHNQSIPND